MNVGSFIFFVLILALCSGCSKIYEVSDPYPTDDVLIESLNRNKQSFEALVKLFEEDAGQWHINADGSSRFGDTTPGNLSDDKRQRYIDLMRVTGVRNISRHVFTPEDKSISLQVWWVKNGPFIGSKAKYLVYKDASPSNLVESLDVIYASGNDAGHSRRIDADWTLFLDVW